MGYGGDVDARAAGRPGTRTPSRRGSSIQSDSGRITGVTKDSANGQSVASYTYGTGADLGKLMTMTEGGSTTTLAYGDAAHAHAVTGRSGGAMTAPDTYTYDGDGNIASRYGGEVYAYDAENRLSAVSTYPTRTDYWYDGLGNMNCRWTVTPGASAGGAANVRDRYIDGLYEEKSTSGQAPVVTKNYYAFGRIIAQRKTTASGSTVTYLLADHLGSTVGTLTDGGAAQHVQYYPYGNVRSGSVATDKMFTGQQREGFSRIGAYFYKGRFYATGLGHFLSADSSTADGLDRYAYVRFNPLRYNDPTGHDPNDGLLWNPVTGQPTASPTPGCDDACGLRGVQAGCALRPDSFFCPGYPGRGGGSGGATCSDLCGALLYCKALPAECGGGPAPTSTPTPTGPVAMPVCGVGAGTCSAQQTGGGGGGCGRLCAGAKHGVHVVVLVRNAPETVAAVIWAEAWGGDCSMNGDLFVVCSNVPGYAHGARGGITIGNAFLSPDSAQYNAEHPALIGHEYRHARQWAALGSIAFPVAYGVAELAGGGGGCGNVFEQGAGLGAGGYNC